MGKRGFKMSQVASTIIHRGQKFLRGVTRGLKHLPQAMRELDGYGRQAANTLNTAADYAALASHQFESDNLRDTANKLAKHGESIHNFRKSDLANKARDQFWTPKEVNPWDSLH